MLLRIREEVDPHLEIAEIHRQVFDRQGPAILFERVKGEVVASDHPCRPCGNDGCGGGKVSECLTTLDVDRVFEAAGRLIAAG